MAEFIRLTHSDMQTALIRARRALEADRLIVIPTETVYGLAGRVSGAVARRIFEVKRRDEGKPLPIIGASVEAFEGHIAQMPTAALVLARHYWPGPLTLVVPRVESLPDVITGGRASVGVRVPNHPFTLALLEHFGGAMIATSANMSEAEPVVDAARLPETLTERVDAVFDAGPCPLQQASTVLDLTVSPPSVLRTGPIADSELHRILNEAREETRQ